MLRILGCERLTNDLDYVFVPFRSKKDVLDDVLAALKELDGAEISHSMNSKCLRIIVGIKDIRIQIEIKTALEMPTRIVSTKDFSALYALPPRLIPIMDYPVALANKLGAWNERRLLRDVYDIWFYLKLGVRPDRQTLEDRLKKPEYSRLVKNAEQFKGHTTSEFYTFLYSHVQKLTDQDIAESLRDYLPEEDLPGLAMRFKAEISKLAP